jgi:hypothetical protein
MAKSRLSMRREVEAAEAIEATPSKAKKKVAKKKVAKKKSTTTRPRKKKADTPARRRLIWVLYSSTMREEGRFLYHERDKAEEKLQALLSKGKRRYFLQPIKEALDADGNPMIPDDADSLRGLRKGVKPGSDDDDDDDDVAVDPEADVDADIEIDVDLDVDNDAEVEEVDEPADD